jgi:hypothetical protein
MMGHKMDQMVDANKCVIDATLMWLAGRASPLVLHSFSVYLRHQPHHLSPPLVWKKEERK